MILDADASQKLVAGIKIPPQPVVVNDLLAEQQKDEPDMQRVARLLSTDPGLSAMALKTVNSCAFGLQSHVASIPQAVMLLGFTNVVSIVISASLRRTMREDVPGMDEFWRRSSDVALAAAEVARKNTDAPPDLAYALGLFYRCGIPLMLQRFPNYHAFMCGHEDVGPAEYKAWENVQFKTNHAVVGYFTARSWRLPMALCRAIHANDTPLALEDPDVEVSRLVAILRLAEHLVD